MSGVPSGPGAVAAGPVAGAPGPHGRTVGILGGGQLGRMLALAGAPLGVRVVAVEPGADPPAAVAAEVVRAPYASAQAVEALAACDVVTVELEGVAVATLEALAKRGVAVRPGPAAVRVSQDRLVEKRHLQAHGIPTAPFAAVDDLASLRAGVTEVGLPAVVKARIGGYDGRGQAVVRGDDDGALAAAWRAVGERPSIVEGFVAFRRELSIVAARAADGTTACYPLVENRHRDGILRVTLAPAPGAPASMDAEARRLVTRLLDSLAYVGVIGLELFDTPGGLVANEFAPRVHNSGHWTIEGAATSQFEQHLRAVLGWPLGPAEPLRHAAMVNLIGGWPDPADALAVPGAHLHLYGKAARPARKVGHVTVVAETAAERDALAARVEAVVAPATDG